MIGIMIIVCSIIVRLFYLQVHLTTDYFVQSQKNFLRIEKIISPRGNIIDCHGKLLVTNRPVINLYWHGKGRRTLPAIDQTTLTTLARILELNEQQTQELANTITTHERTYKNVELATDLSFEQVSQLEELFPHHPHITLITHFERFYPYKSYASHILGYLSYNNFEAIGSMGLEKLFEETLKGQPGTMIKTINSVGRNLHEIEQTKACAGNTLQTTIDIDIQAIVEIIFPPKQAGTFIVMDPLDGALLALVSRPNFDPSIFLNPIPPDEWQHLQEQHPFINRAFNACYPPGSLFKLVTISAALEQGLIDPDACIYCRGYVTFGNRPCYCAQRLGHGTLSIVQAVAESCNTLFYEIGKKIDIDLIASYAQAFGLGQKTNAIFAEKEGLIPTRQWKLKKKGERWWQGETLSAAIGQSFLLATPIQIACMFSSIFTGYLVTPRILLTDPIITKPLNLQEETLQFLRKALRLVVTHGTGRPIGTIKDIIAYAKTSTAQTSSLEKRLLDTKYLEHGIFAAHVIYKDKPLTLLVVLENVGSSSVATWLTRHFLLEYKKLVNSRELNPPIIKE